jgi:hypothetical protein
MAFDRKAANGQAQAALKDGLSGLPDGRYEFEITEFALKDIGTNGLKLARKATVVGGPHDGRGTGQDWDTILTDKGGELMGFKVQQLTKELEALGFPAEEWAAEGAYFDQIDKAAASIVGLRFVGTKKSRTAGDKTYRDLILDDRLLQDGHPVDGKPRTFTEEAMKEANRSAVPF